MSTPAPVTQVVVNIDMSAVRAQQQSAAGSSSQSVRGVPATLHVERDNGSGVPAELVIVRERQARVNFYVESRDGSASRRLEFTPEQQAELERQFAELKGQYPDAEIEFDVTHQRLYVRQPGQEPRVVLIDEESPGAMGLVNALCTYKKDELFVSHIANYSRREKGNTKAPRALLPHSSMTERLQRLNRQDFEQFRRQYESYYLSSIPAADRAQARDRIREKLARAARFHIAYKKILKEEITRLEAEIRSLPPENMPEAAHKRATLQRLKNLLERIKTLDAFAVGWAICDPAFDVNGSLLPAETVVQNAEGCRNRLEQFLRAQAGNSVASTHEDYWFAPFRGRIPDLTSVERDYAADVVGMTIGHRIPYEEFMGERGSRRDSLEELLLLNYANGRANWVGNLPSTGDSDLNMQIAGRLYHSLQAEEAAVSSRPRPAHTPTPVPIPTPALTPAPSAASFPSSGQPPAHLVQPPLTPPPNPASSAAAAAAVVQTPPHPAEDAEASDDDNDVFFDASEPPTPSAAAAPSPPPPGGGFWNGLRSVASTVVGGLLSG